MKNNRNAPQNEGHQKSTTNQLALANSTTDSANYSTDKTIISGQNKSPIDVQASQTEIEIGKTVSMMETESVDDSTPIGWFNANNPIPKLLSDNSYKYVSKSSVNGNSFHRYQSPVSTVGSAEVIFFEKNNRVYCHDESDPLAGKQSHDAFSIAVTLNYKGDQYLLLAEITPEFEKYSKQKKITELLNIKKEKFSEIPEEKQPQFQDITALPDMKYEFKRKSFAKDNSIGVLALDNFRQNIIEIQDQIQTLNSCCNSETDDISTSLAGKITEVVEKEAEFFHDNEDKAYAVIPVNGHTEVHDLKSDKFKNYLRLIAHRMFRVALNDSTIRTIIGSLIAIALFDSKEHDVHLRVAKLNGKYYVDIGNDKWQVIEISSEGYQVLNKSPVYFIRTNSMTSLPIPVTGDIKRLWEFVHITDKKDQLRWLTALIDALRPETVYPIMSHIGGEGSGKTSLLFMIKSLTDPNKLMTRGLSDGVRNFQVAAENNHVLAFENLSTLSDKLSDAFCRASTGSGNSERKLHSNAEEVILKYKRPVIFEGIPFVLKNPDIIDRAVNFDIPELKVHGSESKLSESREQALPEILGAILDIFSQSLAVIDDVQTSADVRMKDFAILGQAVYQVVGQPGNFSVDLLEHQKSLRLRALEGAPIIGVLLNWLDLKTGKKQWEGTLGSLLKELIYMASSKLGEKSTFPKSARGFSEIVQRSAKTLKSLGVTVVNTGKHSREGSIYRITWK